MTPAIESNRFKAKCESGNTYTVVEKTRDIKEPRAKKEQTFILVQTSYFLSTGEKVNKVADKDYLIINKNVKITRKEPVFKKSSITDIKTIFDYLKNQALCIAIVLAIPEMLNLLKQQFGSYWVMLGAFSIAMAMATVFSVYNLIWLFSSLEEKPKLKALPIIALLFALALVIATMAVLGFKATQELNNLI